jgi:hypothetical protein
MRMQHPNTKSISSRQVFEVLLVLMMMTIVRFTLEIKDMYWLLFLCLIGGIYLMRSSWFLETFRRKRYLIPVLIVGALCGQYAAAMYTFDQWKIIPWTLGSFRLESNQYSPSFPMRLTYAGQSHWIRSGSDKFNVHFPEGGLQEIEVNLALFPLQRTIRGKVLARGDTGRIDTSFAKQGSMFLNDSGITSVYAGPANSGTNNIWTLAGNTVQQIDSTSGSSKAIAFPGAPRFVSLSDYGYVAFIEPDLVMRAESASTTPSTERVIGVKDAIPGMIFGRDWRLFGSFSGQWNELRYWDKLRPNELILDVNSYESGYYPNYRFDFVRLVKLNGKLELVWEDLFKSTKKIFGPQAAVLTETSRVHINQTTLFVINQNKKELIIHSIQLDQPAGSVSIMIATVNDFQLLSARTRSDQLVIAGLENGVGKMYFLDNNARIKASSDFPEHTPFSLAVDSEDRIVAAWKSKSGTVIRRYW